MGYHAGTQHPQNFRDIFGGVGPDLFWKFSEKVSLDTFLSLDRKVSLDTFFQKSNLAVGCRSRIRLKKSSKIYPNKKGQIIKARLTSANPCMTSQDMLLFEASMPIVLISLALFLPILIEALIACSIIQAVREDPTQPNASHPDLTRVGARDRCGGRDSLAQTQAVKPRRD